MEEYDRKAWEDLITMCEDAGVDAFEVNFSCPHGMPERRMGMAMGQDCELLQVRRLAGWSILGCLLPATWFNNVAWLPVLAQMLPWCSACWVTEMTAPPCALQKEHCC